MSLKLQTITRLKERLNLYMVLSQKQNRPSGFVHGCDGLLFSGLLAGAGYPLDLRDALDNYGKWHRRPLQLGECYPDESWSSISRDMFLGVLWWVWKRKQLPVLDTTIRYANKHWLEMGNGPLDIVCLTPTMYGTMRLMKEYFGGKSAGVWRYSPIIPVPLKGFRAHIYGLHMLIRSEIFGKMPNSYLRWFRARTIADLNNLFYKAVYAANSFPEMLISVGIDLLAAFPKDRLPNNKDWKEPYLWQRYSGTNDWLPDEQSPMIEHSGADFIFLADYIIEKLERTAI